MGQFFSKAWMVNDLIRMEHICIYMGICVCMMWCYDATGVCDNAASIQQLSVFVHVNITTV